MHHVTDNLYLICSKYYDPDEMKVVLENHRHCHLKYSQGIQHVNVRRSNLFEDCITAFARHSFEPTFSLKVRFIGEPAVDVGGPRQELFRLFFESLGEAGSIFNVLSKGILPIHNVLALSKKVYEVCRKIIAIAIVHGSQKPQCLAPEAAYFMVHGEIMKMDEQAMLEGIADYDIRSKLHKVCHANEYF